MLTPTLKTRIEKLTTPLLADALNRLGLPEVACGGQIRPMIPFSKFVGTAVTVKIRHRREEESADLSHYRESWSTRSFSPIIAIQVTPDLNHTGVFGGGAATYARARSFVGAVVDGTIRDSHELNDMKFPVFCRAIAPLHLPPHARSEFCNQPVVIGNATVSPGDILFADNDGVLVVGPDQLETVVIRAEEIAAWESKMMGSFARGGTFEEALAGAGAMP